MTTVSARYIIDDDAAGAFYVERLGFSAEKGVAG
jgi:hypothetical protein